MNHVFSEAIENNTVKHDGCFLNRRSESPHVNKNQMLSDSFNAAVSRTAVNKWEEEQIVQIFPVFFYCPISQIYAFNLLCVNMHAPKKQSALYFFTKTLHPHSNSTHKKPQPTDIVYRAKRERVRRKQERGLKEYKSLPLFRLVVAVVCCMVFPLRVN